MDLSRLNPTTIPGFTPAFDSAYDKMI
jgi:hypothetical protein